MLRPQRKVLSDGNLQIGIAVSVWSHTGGSLLWRNYDPRGVRDALRAHSMTLTRSCFYGPDSMAARGRLAEPLVECLADPRVLAGELAHEGGRRFVWLLDRVGEALSCKSNPRSGTLRSPAGAPADSPGADRSRPLELPASGGRV